MRKKCHIRLRRLTLWMLACLTAVCLLPGRAEAGGIATDTLTVKVGYYGMDSSQYVEAGTYHWTELQENLTMYYEAYTFFRPTGEGDGRCAGKQRQQRRDAGGEQSRSGFLPPR